MTETTKPPRSQSETRRMAVGFAPLSPTEEALATVIVDSAYTVHSKLGPGLLESVYERCFCYELQQRQIRIQRQVDVPITYDALVIDGAFRLDVLVEDLVICELKAAEEWQPLWEAQLLTYLRLHRKRLGFLINFNVLRIKDGIRRFVL